MKHISKLIVLLLLADFALTLSAKKANDVNQLSAKFENGDSEKRKVLKKIYNKLIDFVVKNEGRINKVALSFGSNDDERFMIATEDIKADEAILKIPDKLIISQEHELLKDFCKKVTDFALKYKLEHEPEDLCLQLWVSKERHNITNSKFQTFVAFLPLNLSNFPILYKPKERKLMKNTYLEELVDSERKFLEEDYKKFKENGSDLLGKTTPLEFFKSYEIFYSRTYQFTNSKGKAITGFIPLVDLFNYKTDFSHKIAWKYNETTEQFIVYAEDDIPKGSKLHIEYGSHSNFQFLAFYGFTIDKNPNKPSYNIYVGEGDKQAVVDILGEIDMMKVLDPLRKVLAKKKPADDDEPRIISVSNELAALTSLKKELDIRVASWKSTLVQDNNILKNAVDRNIKNILRVVTEEKKIVKIYQGLCNQFISILHKKKHSSLTKPQSRLVVLNPYFRAYFEKLNNQLGLDLRPIDNLRR